MPSPNGTAASAPQAAKPRRAPIIPAIPHALSRPKVKSARPQPKTDVEGSSAVEHEEAVGNVANGVKSQEILKTAEVAAPGEETTQATLLNNGRGDKALETDTLPAETSDSREAVTTDVLNGTASIPDIVNGGGDATVPVDDGTLDASGPITMASPSSGRQDKFEMRHIRTELPPAFVPSADQHTPRSANSAASSQSRPYHQHPHSHPVHPSASSIVFGGHESTASSPAPPLSAGSAYAPPQYPQPPTMASHTHHLSEPQLQRMHQPPYAQQPMPWSMRGFGESGPQPFYRPHAHMLMRHPAREPFPQSAPMANGFASRSRSGSASPSLHDGQRVTSDLRSTAAIEQPDSAKALYPEPKSAGFASQHRPFPPQQMQHQPPMFPHPEEAAAMENAGTMRDHILSQWLNPELADCLIQVTDLGGTTRASIEGHKLILSRSPTLLSLIRDRQTTSSAGVKMQLDVELISPYVRVSHFSEAIRHLYGAALPRFDFYRSLETNGERIHSALGFIAAGAWLGIPAIAHQSIDVACSFLQWDTYPVALAFALDGGLDQAWPIGDGSEERASTCSSDDSFSKPEAGGAPTYDPYSTVLLHRIIDFTVQNLPPNFYLDQTAPQLASCPRLPISRTKHESKSSRSDPRLSKIRFGEIPVEDHQRPSHVTTAISSILLSLPFPLLKYLLEHPLLTNRLGPETVGSIMRQVVLEREVRRHKARGLHTAGSDDDHTVSQQVHNLYWVELVEQSAQHRAGSRLARRRQGIDTPPSSGAESERVK